MALVKRHYSAAGAPSTVSASVDIFKRLDRADLLRAPVNIHAVAEFLGLDIVEEVMDDEMSGYIEPRRGGWVIGVNAFHHPNRQRFTIAHEIGHFALHKPAERVIDITFARRIGGRDKLEREADDFAAKLLMPEDEVRRAINSGENSLEGLAAKFKVSAMAVKFRAQSLGYTVK